jgi:hypothetical protein
MTPQEKAQELIKKFSFNTRCFSETKGWEDSFFDAKECALIAVAEIISVIDPETNFATWLFWKEVKKEIELL